MTFIVEIHSLRKNHECEFNFKQYKNIKKLSIQDIGDNSIFQYLFHYGISCITMSKSHRHNKSLEPLNTSTSKTPYKKSSKINLHRFVMKQLQVATLYGCVIKSLTANGDVYNI